VVVEREVSEIPSSAAEEVVQDTCSQQFAEQRLDLLRTRLVQAVWEEMGHLLRQAEYRARIQQSQ
jgi:hypothetical protein